MTPGDYGLIGMLSVFFAISDVFISSGFADALVQKNKCTDEDYSTAFYFNVSVAIFIYVILFFTAPLISKFYHEPQLTIIMRVMALNFVFGSLNIVQQAKLTKLMNFRPLAIINFVGTIVSGCVGVGLAFFGYGVWALVLSTLSSTLLRVVLFPFFTKWRPNGTFSLISLKMLWHYGSKLLVTGIFGVVVRNLSSILLGRFYDKDQVGYYSRSQGIADLPSDVVFRTLHTVTFPALCESQNDRVQMMSVYKRILFNTVLITCPIIILLMILSKPLILVLFTDRWAACIPLCQALLLARMTMPIGAIHTSLLRSVGNTTLYMKLYFITAPLSLLAVVVSIPFGVVAMAWATFAGSVFSYSIPAIVIGRKYGYGFLQQLWDWRKIFISLVLMSIGTYFGVYFISSMWLQLFVGTIIGALIYFCCCKLFGLIDDDLIKLIKSKLKF